MPDIAEVDSMQSLTTPSNYAFSGVGLDQLGATEYTLATVVVDVSGSVHGFKNELEKSLKTILGSVRKLQELKTFYSVLFHLILE